MNISTIRNYFWPCLHERSKRQSSDTLNRRPAPSNVAVDRLEREIELLREYRTRLVADVVTGKLDVREAAAGCPRKPHPSTAEDDTDLTIDTETADEEVAV